MRAFHCFSGLGTRGGRLTTGARLEAGDLASRSMDILAEVSKCFQHHTLVEFGRACPGDREGERGVRFSTREKTGRERVRAGVENTQGLLEPCSLDEDADVLDAVFFLRFVTLDTDNAEELVLEVLHFVFDLFGARIE